MVKQALMARATCTPKCDFIFARALTLSVLFWLSASATAKPNGVLSWRYPGFTSSTLHWPEISCAEVFETMAQLSDPNRSETELWRYRRETMVKPLAADVARLAPHWAGARGYLFAMEPNNWGELKPVVYIPQTTRQNIFLTALEPEAAPFRFKDRQVPPNSGGKIPFRDYREGILRRQIPRDTSGAYFQHDVLEEHVIGALAIREVVYRRLRERAAFIQMIERLEAQSSNLSVGQRELIRDFVTRMDELLSGIWDDGTSFLGNGIGNLLRYRTPSNAFVEIRNGFSVLGGNVTLHGHASFSPEILAMANTHSMLAQLHQKAAERGVDLPVETWERLTKLAKDHFVAPLTENELIAQMDLLAAALRSPHRPARVP